MAEAGSEEERETGGVVPSSRWDLPLLLEGQMPSQEQEREEKNSIRDQIGDPVKQRIQ
jgi:hypothetical protein